MSSVNYMGCGFFITIDHDLMEDKIHYKLYRHKIDGNSFLLHEGIIDEESPFIESDDICEQLAKGDL